MLPDELLQLPLLSSTALREHGVSATQLRQALTAGTLSRLKRGWYTPKADNRPATWHRLRVQVELADHPDMVPSHHSAAVLLGYPVHRPDWRRVQLMRTTPGPAHSRPTVVIHQQVDDARTLIPELAIAQTALHCPVSGLMALDHALHIGAVSLDAIERWSGLLRDRVGRIHLPLVVNLADSLRESPLESRTALTFHGWGWSLESQFQVPGTRYRADARLRGTNVLVESDGAGKYDEPGSEFNEKVREDRIRDLGWEVIRVTSALLDNPAELFRRVKSATVRAQRAA